MTIKEWMILAGVAAGAAVASTSALVAAQALSGAPAAQKHPLPTSRNGNLVVGLCDGETALEVDGVKEGQAMDRGRAQAVAAQLMADWRRKNPQVRWDDRPLLAQAPATGKDPPSPRSPTQIEKAKSATEPGKSGVTAGDTASTGAKEGGIL